MEGLATAIARIERSVRVSDAPEVSLGFLHKTNPFRAMILRAVTWPGTDWVLLILILLNAAALGSQDPTSPNSSGNRSLFLLNIALNVVFTAEMLAKIAAFGLWGPGSYIADKWNWSASGRGQVRAATLHNLTRVSCSGRGRGHCGLRILLDDSGSVHSAAPLPRPAMALQGLGHPACAHGVLSVTTWPARRAVCQYFVDFGEEWRRWWPCRPCFAASRALTRSLHSLDWSFGRAS